MEYLAGLGRRPGAPLVEQLDAAFLRIELHERELSEHFLARAEKLPVRVRTRGLQLPWPQAALRGIQESRACSTMR